MGRRKGRRNVRERRAGGICANEMAAMGKWVYTVKREEERCEEGKGGRIRQVTSVLAMKRRGRRNCKDGKQMVTIGCKLMDFRLDYVEERRKNYREGKE